jgi:hypothetical protein
MVSYLSQSVARPFDNSGVISILLRLYTTTEHLKTVSTSPHAIYQICYFREKIYLNIVNNFYLLALVGLDPHHFNADPDPAFHFNEDPDPAFYFNVDTDPNPAPHQSDGNLRPLVYRPSKVPFEHPGLHCERSRPSTTLF